jgi:hypothetical protein
MKVYTFRVICLAPQAKIVTKIHWFEIVFITFVILITSDTAGT